MLDARAADVRRAHGVVEAVGAAIDPETTGLVPRWKILVPLAHARRPLGAMLVLGRPGATLSDSERDLWESVAGTISAALHAADDFEHVVALEAEKRQLVDSLPVIVARLDPKTGATLFVNGAIERVLGFTTVEVQGQPGMDGLLADPIEWEASAVARDAAARGRESAWQDRRYRHKDGRVLTLRESIYPVRDPSGSVRAIQVIAYDVSTEIESRKQLMQADRLASLGSLAGGIAHEINNPVAFIGLAASQLVKMIEPLADAGARDRARQLVLEVGEAAARIANIVGELKLFTRIPEGAHVTPVDINRIVQMAVTLTSAELRRRARVEMNLGELPLVPGEYAILGQAFVNLLLNAAQAVHAKREAGSASNFVRVSTFVAERAIVVRVSDTGVGIEPRVLPRIFDPFFKTKQGGDGAGLGLAIAHNLVRRVGGDIRVTSEPGEGSTFEVILPLDAAAEGRRPRPEHGRCAPRRSCRRADALAGARPHRRRRAGARERPRATARRPVGRGHGLHRARRARRALRPPLRRGRLRSPHARPVRPGDLRRGPRPLPAPGGPLHLHHRRQLRRERRRDPRAGRGDRPPHPGEAVRRRDVRGARGEGRRPGRLETVGVQVRTPSLTSASRLAPPHPPRSPGRASRSAPSPAPSRSRRAPCRSPAGRGSPRRRPAFRRAPPA